MIDALAFVIIGSCTAAGLFGFSIWLVLLGGLALAGISAFKNHELLRVAWSLSNVGSDTLAASLFNGLVACSTAFGFGFVIGLVG